MFSKRIKKNVNILAKVFKTKLYSCDLCDYIGITSDFKTRKEIIDHLTKKHNGIKPPYQDYFSNQ